MYICLEANDAFFRGGYYIRQRDTRSKVDGAGLCKRNVVLSILFSNKSRPVVRVCWWLDNIILNGFLVHFM